jgi:hypothetical protein
LAQVIVTNPTCIGIGIEGFDIRGEFAEDKSNSARDLRVHLLADGDTYIIPQINPPHK